jgi:hypothetical protein
MKSKSLKSPLGIIEQPEVDPVPVKTTDGSEIPVAPLVPDGTVKESGKSPEEIAQEVDVKLPTQHEVRHFVLATFTSLLAAAEARHPVVAHDREEIDRIWTLAMKAGSWLPSIRNPLVCSKLSGNARSAQRPFSTHECRSFRHLLQSRPDLAQISSP